MRRRLLRRTGGVALALIAVLAAGCDVPTASAPSRVPSTTEASSTTPSSTPPSSTPPSSTPPSSTQPPGTSPVAVIEQITEDIGEGRVGNGEGCADGQTIEEVTDPVRAGTTAFRHTVRDCGERAEFSGRPTDIGDTYSMGWSVNHRMGDGIANQWAVYPTDRNFRSNGCSAVGSYMLVGDGGLQFVHRFPGAGDDIACTKYPIAGPEVHDQWVDLVMQVKWTGGQDGFLRIWSRSVGGDFVQKVDYSGPTHWDDEDRGPYFKMGCYTGDPGRGDCEILTDEYRLAEGLTFDVVPGGTP